jgi:hypothetical protein
MMTDDEAKQIYSIGFKEGWEQAVKEIDVKIARMKTKQFTVTVTSTGEEVE